MAAAAPPLARVDLRDVPHWDETRPGDSVNNIENAVVISGNCNDIIDTNAQLATPDMTGKTDAQRTRILHQERIAFHIFSTVISAYMRTHNHENIVAYDCVMSYVRDPHRGTRAVRALKDLYLMMDLPMQVSLLRELFTARMGTNGNLRAHIVSITRKFARLQDGDRGQHLSEEMKVGILFASLPATYDTIMQQLLYVAGRPVQNVNYHNVTEQLLAFDAARAVREAVEENDALNLNAVQAFAAMGVRGGNRGGRAGRDHRRRGAARDDPGPHEYQPPPRNAHRVCFNCASPRHWARVCGMAVAVCEECGGRGHMTKFCHDYHWATRNNSDNGGNYNAEA